MNPQICSAPDAVRQISDGSAVWVGGSGAGHGVPQALIEALADEFTRTGRPRDLTTVRVVGIGDFGDVGFSQLALPGLMKRTIGSNIGNEPRLGALVAAEALEAYSFPQGVLAALLRDIAGGRPGHVTHIGLGTYVDPRHTGGKQNAVTTEDLVEVVTLGGREWLFYHRLDVDCAIIRASTADEDGNLTFEDEAILGDSLALAMAAHNNGGRVIAQVAKVVSRRTLRPADVRIPGALINTIVVVPDQRQTYKTRFSPFYSGQLRAPAHAAESTILDARKVIARRSLMEFKPGDICNLGFGISQQIGTIASEEGITDRLTLTVEQGIFGGIPAHGPDGGAGINYQARLEQPSMFDFYDGGGLDIASLSFAQVDRGGNVNVHLFDDRLRGPGGFINISARTQRLCFVGTFTAGGLRVVIDRGTLHVDREGRNPKFVRTVREISFNGSAARQAAQSVLYITERAVFELTDDGFALIEIAPGIDIERHILRHMEFEPDISDPVRTMDDRLFRDEPMGLLNDFTGAGTDHG